MGGASSTSSARSRPSGVPDEQWILENVLFFDYKETPDGKCKAFALLLFRYGLSCSGSVQRRAYISTLYSLPAILSLVLLQVYTLSISIVAYEVLVRGTSGTL